MHVCIALPCPQEKEETPPPTLSTVPPELVSSPVRGAVKEGREGTEQAAKASKLNRFQVTPGESMVYEAQEVSASESSSGMHSASLINLGKG